MAKSKKRRVTRVGPKHRMWITIEKDTFEALQASGEKLGFSISALVQRVVVRGIAAGLIDDPSPTLNEQYYQLTEELCRSQKDHIEILQDRIDLKEQMIAHMQRGLEDYAETIAQQARDINRLEDRVLELHPTVVFDVAATHEEAAVNEIRARADWHGEKRRELLASIKTS